MPTMGTRTAVTWRDLAFENVCFDHVKQIKQALEAGSEVPPNKKRLFFIYPAIDSSISCDQKKILMSSSGMEWNIISTTISAGVILSCINHSWVIPIVP